MIYLVKLCVSEHLKTRCNPEKFDSKYRNSVLDMIFMIILSIFSSFKALNNISTRFSSRQHKISALIQIYFQYLKSLHYASGGFVAFSIIFTSFLIISFRLLFVHFISQYAPMKFRIQFRLNKVSTPRPTHFLLSQCLGDTHTHTKTHTLAYLYTRAECDKRKIMQLWELKL